MSDNHWPFGRDRDAEDGQDTAALPDEEPHETTRLPADETAGGPVARAGGSHERPPEDTNRRLRFRRWRRTRPFWGGVLLILAGIEIAIIPAQAWHIILIASSVAIATGVGLIILILGIVTLMTPSQNKLYGLLGVLMGGISFVTSNLGGFLLGAVLAIVGGALTFAWTELAPEEQPDWASPLPPAPQQPTVTPGRMADEP